MAVYWCLVRNPLCWLAALCSLLAFTHSPSCGFVSIVFASSGFILCPIIQCRSWRCEHTSKRREESTHISTEAVVITASDVQENMSTMKKFLQEQVSEASAVSNQSDAQHQSKANVEEQQLKEEETVCGYLLRSSEALLSDSESQDQTISSDDYSENDSIFRENLSHGTTFSDGSISDEESLIEIELPTGQYVDPKRSQEQSWYGFQQKWPDCSLESRFKQQNWMDMLSELNDENFIEFDICMGSIKCSRFEIKA